MACGVRASAGTALCRRGARCGPQRLDRLHSAGGNGHPIVLGLALREKWPSSGGVVRRSGAPASDLPYVPPMRWFSDSTLWVAALFSAAVVVPFLPAAHKLSR